MQGFLQPGEQVELNFTVCILPSNAQDLNIHRETLECTLILHTLLGKDHFLVVTGQYSVF